MVMIAEPAPKPTFAYWLQNALPGERFTYYIGELGPKREQIRQRSEFVGPEDAQQIKLLNEIDEANQALDAADAGLVHLFQRRVGSVELHHRMGGEDNHKFEYLAQKARPRRKDDKAGSRAQPRSFTAGFFRTRSNV